MHRGLLGLLPVPARPVAHSAVEHSAVLHALAWRQRRRGRAVRVDRLGRVGRRGTSDGPDVVALQHANHEVGTLQPVAEAAGGAPLFMDACASMGRLPLPEGWSVRRGLGPQVGRPGRRRRAAGPQGRRAGATRSPTTTASTSGSSGFENVPAALAAAAALQAVVAERDEVNARQHALVDRIRARVAEIPDAEVVGDPVDRLPHLVTFSFLYVDGEAIVDALDRRGFGVASGSACTASTLEPSHVLAAMGVLTHGNVRVSLTRDATEADVDGFLAALPEVVARDPARTAGL